MAAPEDEPGVNLLSTLPDVVYQKHLFPKLHTNDVLRLRRVSKDTKAMSDTYFHSHPVLHEVEISEHDEKSVSAFVQMNISASHLYLNNDTVTFFEQEDIPIFLEEYGQKITHLRVRNFFALGNPAERQFYDGLVTLEHLELENVDTSLRKRRKMDTDQPHDKSKNNLVSDSFKNLKSLKFGHIQTPNRSDHSYWEKFVMGCCSNLELIGHPLHDEPAPRPSIFGNGMFGGSMNDMMGLIIENLKLFGFAESVFRLRAEKFPDRPNVQFYDLGNFRDEQRQCMNSVGFMYFVRQCQLFKVHLLNVDAALYSSLSDCHGSEDTTYFKDATTSLVSLRNVRECLLQQELENLEHVTITGTLQCSFSPAWVSRRLPRPEWPKLKSLDVTVDSTTLGKGTADQGYPEGVVETQELVDFLFSQGPRLGVTELVLRYDKRGVALPPAIGDLRQACPNLKRLTFGNLPVVGETLAGLWAGLEQLEELVLQDCKYLGNGDFIGEKEEEPKFLKLKALKKLTIVGLEAMPNLSDLAFDTVFRHMTLQKLILRSKEPLTNITPVGIRSLLSGRFADSIEIFPFSDFSLEGLPQEEFLRMERQFRSYYMT